MKKLLGLDSFLFHQIGPLGQFNLVVAMSVHIRPTLFVPFLCDFFAWNKTGSYPTCNICKQNQGLVPDLTSGDLQKQGGIPSGTNIFCLVF